MCKTTTSNSSSERVLTLAYSPCPNDTFIFHGLAQGHLTLEDASFTVCLQDVETLNQAAVSGTYDVTKLSFHAFLKVRDSYRLLRSGAALGHGCGPILVSRKPVSVTDIPSLRVAIPGELTTAHLLFRLFAPTASNKLFCSYDNVIPAVLKGEVDLGVIIHEDRFVFGQKGLSQVVDLGQWWEESTGAAIPLGCIAIREELADRFAQRVDTLIRKSIQRARSDLSSSLPYIRTHAQALDEGVLRQHIDMFVNDWTVDLGQEGDRAVAILEQMAKKAGVIP